jgi:sec-independent protein translocase protein TatA
VADPTPNRPGTVFDISPIQILMVAVIALLVFGPKRLPEIGRQLGRGLREFRSVVSLEPDPPGSAPRAGAPAARPADEDDVLEGVVVPAGTPAPSAATIPPASPPEGPAAPAAAADSPAAPRGEDPA